MENKEYRDQKDEGFVSTTNDVKKYLYIVDS